jgi:hypothetical protein
MPAAAKAPQPPPASRFELMTSADGRRYNCTLPPLPGAAGAGQAVGATAVAATTVGGGAAPAARPLLVAATRGQGGRLMALLSA